MQLSLLINNYVPFRKSSLLSVSWGKYVSVSHPIITTNHFKHISPTNFPMFHFSLFISLFPFSPSLSLSWGHDHELQDTSFSLQHLDTWHFLSLPPHSICLWHTFVSPNREQEEGKKRGTLSFLTQASGVKWSMSLTLPLPSATPCAQTLERVALAICFGPGISNTVGGQSILVVTAICERGEWKELIR